MRYLSELTGSEIETRTLPEGWQEMVISGVTADSRQVKPGYLFVAVSGVKQDGRAFIPQAVALGAAAIITDKLPEDAQNHKAPILLSANARLSLCHIAARFYGLQPAHVVAVTGTDGKTSTAHFYQQFWKILGKKSASIGTLGVIAPEGLPEYPAINTTPDPVLLHRTLADLARHGVEYAAMEASSHGLDQHRLDGVKLQAAGFTNLTRDHLDYHLTDEAYFAAKLRLFTEVLAGGGTVVLNADDARFAELKAASQKSGHKIISYGWAEDADMRLQRLTPQATGQEAKTVLFGKEYVLKIPLIGAFQLANILCAMGLAIACGAEVEALVNAIPELKGVPGRMEPVATHMSGAPVFVDYAHTPGGLKSVLTHIRPHVKGRIYVVFGCGGDRDRGKRPQMGAIAAELADKVFVTDDNPRTENPTLIRKDVMQGCPGATEIEGRKEAIFAAVRELRAGDALVIAGKGHEKTQIIGDKTYPFDDGLVAKEGVAA